MKKTKLELFSASGQWVGRVTLPDRPDISDELPRMMVLPNGRRYVRCADEGVYIEAVAEA